MLSLGSKQSNDCTKNLIFHFYCIEHARTFDAIHRLKHYIDLFDGHKILTLTSPNNNFADNSIFHLISNTFMNDNVQFLLGHNHPTYRESHMFFDFAQPLLWELDGNRDSSYTFYGHNKGTTHPENSLAIKCWVDTLWKYNIEDYEQYVEPNFKKYDMIGCLRLGEKQDFHYSGTFFWFKTLLMDPAKQNYYSDKNKWSHNRYGVEMWPHTVTTMEETINTHEIPLNWYRAETYYKDFVWMNSLCANK